MKTVVIVQARMGSTRLVGKVLKTVLGKTLLEYQVERLARVGSVDQVVVATTANDIDQPIADLCEQLDHAVFRGSEEDVLARYWGAAREHCAECVVRVNADCPLIDPAVVERVVGAFKSSFPTYDYAANILERSYPIGMHTEVFSVDALEWAYDNASEALEREHVTPAIYRTPERFELLSVTHDEDLSHHRWTVDVPEDFELMEKIISTLYPQNPVFDMHDVLALLEENPEWSRINSHVHKEQTV